MKKRSAIFLAVSIPDLFRFFLIVGVWMAARSLASGLAVQIEPLSSGAETVPVPLYLAPAALFPIMAFFMWRDASYFVPYARLYTAGKLIGIVTVIFWLKERFSIRDVLLFFQFEKRAFLGVIAAPLILIWDALSVALIIMSFGTKKTEAD